MRTKVLLVDDEEAILALLQRFMEELGYDFLLAHNGAEALEVLSTERVDVVVTDVEMPVIDGWELASRVKEEYPDVRVVGMSGTVEPRAREESLFDAFMHKPFTLRALRKAIADETVFSTTVLDSNTVVDFTTVSDSDGVFEEDMGLCGDVPFAGLSIS